MGVELPLIDPSNFHSLPPNLGLDSLIPATGPLYGDYRGIVVGVDDPEMRGRYQVFVYGVNRYFDDSGIEQALSRHQLIKLRDGGSSINGFLNSLPPINKDPDNDGDDDTSSSGDDDDDADADPRTQWNSLPWAELVCTSNKDAGDVPYYSIGDTVWVRFEGGCREYPLLVGGWLSYAMGPNDLGYDINSPYPESRRCWSRHDTGTNNVEVSALFDATWLRFTSGNAELFVNRVDNSVRVDADIFGVETETISMYARGQGVFLAGSDVYIQALAGGEPPSIGGEGATPESQAQLSLYSNYRMDVYAKYEIWLGQYLARDEDDEGLRTWQQTRLLTVAPRFLILGMVCQGTKTAYNYYTYDDDVNAENTDSVDIERSITLRSALGNRPMIRSQPATVGWGCTAHIRPSYGRSGWFGSGNSLTRKAIPATAISPIKFSSKGTSTCWVHAPSPPTRSRIRTIPAFPRFGPRNTFRW